MLSSYVIALLVHVGCSKGDDSKAPVAITPIEKLSKLDVCGCNQNANVILDASYDIRKKFIDMDALKKDVDSVDRIRSWAKNWTKVILYVAIHMTKDESMIGSTLGNMVSADSRRLEDMRAELDDDDGTEIMLFSRALAAISESVA